MPATIQKWGNGLGVRISKSIAKQLKLCVGMKVEFATVGGALTLWSRRRSKYKLSDLLAKWKGHNRHGELFPGGPVGRELI